MPKQYPKDLKNHALQLLFSEKNDHHSRSAALAEIAKKLAINPETLRLWAIQAERDAGIRAGITSSERTVIAAQKKVARKNARHAEIVAAVATFSNRELDPHL